MERKDIERVTPLIRALYLGQSCYAALGIDGRQVISDAVVSPTDLDKSIRTWHLFLRPLSSLSDDEAIQVAKALSLVHATVMSRSETAIMLTDDSYTLTIVFSGLIAMAKRGLAYADRLFVAYDYLRGQGFALPYYDHVTGTTLTPEAMQQYGIIKLTQ
jgi:hypothetical protein